MTPETLLQALADFGIEARTIHHPPVFTVAESRALRGELPGAHSKNLFLRAAKGEGFFLAVLEEHRQASVNALARAAGWPKVRMASAEELRATLGVEPGSVTPFGLVNAPPGGVGVVLDAALAHAPGLAWFHPLVNTASTGLRPPDLLRFLAARGHVARVLDLDAMALA
ncbi:prolyl-tRNA synthetase associated domain-containing protein [Roseococcus microcysteis]|uniref:prolyl-tRNA synthetase associated domain-containing protein n=1 Tax=Roseococcus microcysteis TaxID=2771361 RepID=UPI00168A685F|nr:prolyl-tRNA synthetase associated domain-containing protein [Roseococcus microcysteis]